MKQMAKTLYNYVFLLAVQAVLLLSSCDGNNDPVSPNHVLPAARITQTYRLESAKTTVHVMEYPSSDPFGKPCMLSGVITIGDEVTKDVPARGMLLYNHYTVYRADQCPSRGNLAVHKMVTGSGLITVSADYYGFGVTEDKQQAYCIGSVNAQASVDALIAARQLLKSMGYQWNDVLFNAGYSQGGQTSMAVLRLVTEKYPDIHITYTFAGGGSYDIPETYRQFIQTGTTAMPSTVISVLLAYNEYFSLNIPRKDVFVEPTLSHIDDWVLSKRFTREEIDKKVGSGEISAFVTPTMLDLNSDLSKQFMAAFEKDNLSKGWSPRKGDKVLITHNRSDGAVPVVNAEKMYELFLSKGLNVSMKSNDQPDILVRIDDWGAWTLFNLPAHETGALMFVTATIAKVCDELNIKPWFTITPEILGL